MVSRLAARGLGLLPLAGTCASTLTTLGCCGVAILGPAGALVSLGGATTIVPSAWAYEALYASLGLMLLVLALNIRRHRRVAPLVLAALGAGALLLALHEAWDVGLFRILVWGGVVGLAGAGVTDLQFSARACHRGPAG